ncbi:amino acid ABC transporter substrate-binding protein [Caproiciproducens sp. CPB-2]|uniref:amino acid ABC transporter substrate-binding protein n=1 Tax=unclassified Caproiciproducens TaxID=2643836 RepID=UPI0023DA841C|nr:amino acid ABC transporter substrate-binding protein [Caproiciproducens sp. CPB-2]MDF1495592.1 amino acid ABC transporter substrate-binding protein [Caproiciproducens sp. CPB-2]
MKKILSLLLAAGIALSCAACGGTAAGSTGTASAADESWTKVEKAGKLVLGLDDAFPPMGYVDTKTGELVGFDIDLAKEACKRLNIELKTQPIDWDSKTAELNNGNIDCLWNGFSKTDEREKEFSLSIPYMKNEQIILVKTDSSYQGLESLAGKTIGVQSDSSAEVALNENEDFKKTLKSVVQIDDYSKAVMELQNGTIDAISIDEVVARYYLTNNPNAYKVLQDKDGKDASLATEDYVVGFRKADSALTEKINGVLKEMAADGTMASISQKWFGEDVTTVEK